MSVAKNVVGAVKKASPVFAGGVNTQWKCGNEHQLPQLKETHGEMTRKFLAFTYKQQDYCKLGLLNHDLIAEDHIPRLAKARARMNPEELQHHYFRLNRALLLSSRKHILSPEEWTPMDAPHMYLDELIAQIEKEEYEKKLMKCATNDYDDNWDRLFLVPFRVYNYKKIMDLRGFLGGKMGISAM